MAMLADRPTIPPRPPEKVYDSLEFMTIEGRKALVSRLVDYQNETKHEIAVWIGDAPKGAYGPWCHTVFNAFGIGRKGKDDGVLLFIFDSGHWQITVGYGLEKAITDREATAIIRTVPGHSLRAGDRDKAVNDTVDAIMAEIKKSEKP